MASAVPALLTAFAERCCRLAQAQRSVRACWVLCRSCWAGVEGRGPRPGHLPPQSGNGAISAPGLVPRVRPGNSWHTGRAVALTGAQRPEVTRVDVSPRSCGSEDTATRAGGCVIFSQILKVIAISCFAVMCLRFGECVF